MTTPHKRGNLSAPAQNRFEPQRIVLDVPTRHCNTSQPRDSYRRPAWNVRANADDHLQIKSLGVLTSLPKEQHDRLRLANCRPSPPGAAQGRQADLRPQGRMEGRMKSNRTVYRDGSVDGQRPRVRGV